MSSNNNQSKLSGYKERMLNGSPFNGGKRPPGSTFSQNDLDTFNQRQDDYRRAYASINGPESLKDVTRYEKVEDIPQYSQEEYRQYINDWTDQRKAAQGPKYNVPDNPAYGKGPMNKRLTQEFKDGLASLTDKYMSRSVGPDDYKNFQKIQIAEDIPNSSENVARNAQNAGATQTQNNAAQSFQQQRADSQQSGNRESAGYAQMASNMANMSSRQRGGNGQMASNSARASRRSNSKTAQSVSNVANASRRSTGANKQAATDAANGSRSTNTNTRDQAANSRKKRKSAKERAQGWKERWKSRRNRRTSNQTSANKPTNADDTTPQKFGKEGAVVNQDRSPQ